MIGQDQEIGSIQEVLLLERFHDVCDALIHHAKGLESLWRTRPVGVLGLIGIRKPDHGQIRLELGDNMLCKDPRGILVPLNIGELNLGSTAKSS